MKNFSCDVCQRSTKNDVKFAVPAITKNVQLHNKDTESTNSLKVNISQSVSYILERIVKDYASLLKYNLSVGSRKGRGLSIYS